MDLGGGAEAKFKFFRMWSCCISNEIESQCSYMVANILPADPGVKIQLFLNMVMLHIILKGMTHCCNMVAILPADPPPPMKIKLFQNMVKLHIKLNGIANAATFPQHS